MEEGAYVLNFNGCVLCGHFNFPDSVNANNLDPNGEPDKAIEDNIERINYDHQCTQCQHLVAKHEYTFEVVDGVQEYCMNCELCGIGEHSSTVNP